MTKQPTLSYDPYDPSKRVDPYPAYAELRERCPVYRTEVPNAEIEKTNANPIIARPTKEFWNVARYDDIMRVVQDHATYSSTQGPAPERLEAQAEGGMLIYADPPYHSRQRRIVLQAFKPSVIEPMRPQFEKICDDLIDGFIADGRCDATPAYTSQVPLQVISIILGIPASDREKFARWTNDAINAFGGDAEAYEKSYQSLLEYQEYFQNEITRRREKLARGEELSQDVLSRMINAEYEERQFTDVELQMATQVLLLAGVDTLNHATSNGIHLLLTHPEARKLLDDEPQRWPVAIEEILRFEPPAQALFRNTTRATELARVPIPEDAKVRLLFASGNRDTNYLADADVFRVDREAREVRKHLSFGFGIHACLGAALGRTVLEIALRTLLSRLPDVQLDPDRPAQRNTVRFHTRSWDQLPLIWTPPA